jgi:hypothetical protein
MDFTQNKLSRSEWENIEIPVMPEEKKILELILNGYHDGNIRHNETLSLFSFIKIEKTPEIEYLLYKKYFEDLFIDTIKKYGKKLPPSTLSIINNQGIGRVGGELKKLKSADSIRIQNLDNNIKINKPIIYEFLLFDLWKELIKHISKQKQKYAFYLYTLLQLKKASISNINQYVIKIIDETIAYANSFTKTSEIITNAYEFIEKNMHLLKYEDKTLFKHQKELFTICKDRGDVDGSVFTPKLVLYTAPTGTGKTLSPIGLSEKYRIIFVCVARHIGLALAKSAISVEKKVAFAFGCESASDIRLHYFAAIDYTKNWRSGGIGKVDNSVGNNVEIMICDVKSYVTAMHYMLAFNPAEKIITYWDEPTITMDYEEHPLHSTIKHNWTENKIPTFILSCATLPTIDELRPVFDDFRYKFDNAEIHTITSFDCRKSIPILNKEGYCVLPHFMHPEYKELRKCVQYCMDNKTLLRYFDLREIIRFIEYMNEQDYIDESYSIDAYFGGNITDITMNTLKEYYLEMLLHLDDIDDWPAIYGFMTSSRKRKYAINDCKPMKNHVTDGADLNHQLFKKSVSISVSEGSAASSSDSMLKRTNSISLPPTHPASSSTSAATGILLTTSDAHTLTDGPTIFLAEDVSKIGMFYIQQSNIAPSVFQNILGKIVRNSEIIKQIDRLEQMIQLKETKTSGDSGGGSSDLRKGKGKGKTSDSVRESGRLCNESEKMMEEINKLRKEIRLVSLDPMYVPNTRPHQQIWAPLGEIRENSFVSNIGEDVAKTIMMLDIENNLKVLLLLGIGMFTDIQSIEYMEIMKCLANEQRLFIIIASTDYVYGTNYQFCHGFIGKDLTRMTQQKTLQAMGRIGRNNIQQDYTIRFRDDEMIAKLFEKPEINLEAINMCSLFSS